MEDKDIEKIAQAIAAKLAERAGNRLLACGDASSTGTFECGNYGCGSGGYECGGAGRFNCDGFQCSGSSGTFECRGSYDGD